jgi:hypothetical protein
MRNLGTEILLFSDTEKTNASMSSTPIHVIQYCRIWSVVNDNTIPHTFSFQ